MMKRVVMLGVAWGMIFGFLTITHATLWDRGGGLIYDDELNITWLQDANLAWTNKFGVSDITWDGQMSWYTAIEFIAAMNTANYLGYNDWRLPTTAGTGYNDGTEGEMGYLFWETLWTSEGINSGPFTNIQSFVYWTGTECDYPTPGHAWTFAFDYGGQHEYDKNYWAFVWPVRDGDVVVAVTVDIKPGSYPNSINLNSAGVVPVAILSFSEFDATQVDPATVSLAGAKVKLIGKGDKYSCSTQDVNGDGLVDLLCHVVTAQFMIEPGTSVAVMEATTFGGKAIRGEDSIEIVP